MIVTVVLGSMIQQVMFTSKLSKFTAAAVVVTIVAVVLDVVALGGSREVVGPLKLLQDVGGLQVLDLKGMKNETMKMKE